MYDFKPRQKSKEKFTTIGFGPSENYQPSNQLFTIDDKKNTLNKPPSLNGVNDNSFDRESHHSRRSGSEKKHKKESSLLGVQSAQNTGNRQFSFEPVDVQKFKSNNLVGTNQVLPPMERDRSETSRKSSKSKKKPKDTMLMNPDVVNAILKQPNVEPPKWTDIQSPQQRQQDITYMQPQPATRKQIYDLTAQSPMAEQPSQTERGTSEKSAGKCDKRKPKDNMLLEGLGQQKPNKPFTFGDVLNKKEVQSIPSTPQMEYSEVNSVQFDGTSPFQLQRQNKFFEDSKVNPPGERKRKEANKLGNLFQERNKSRSIENVSKISETSGRQKSRIGELFRERKSQQKSKIDEKNISDNSRPIDKLQKPFGDNDNTIKPAQVGVQLCNYAKAYQAAKPLEMRMQQHRNNKMDVSPEIFKDNAPSMIAYSPSIGNSPMTLEIPSRPVPRPPQINTLLASPSIPSLLQDNSPSGFNEKNSFLRYSQTPPKDGETSKHANMVGAKESLFFNLQNDDKLAGSRQKKKGLMVTSKDTPIVPVVQKKDIKEASDKRSDSVKSNSHEKEKKKVKESTLQALSKPTDQKFFDFKVRNSPSKVNDSYYSDDAPQLIPQPPSTRRDSKPTVITFEDEPPKTYSPEVMKKSFTPIVSKTTDNFYPKDQGNSSIYDQSLQSANSSGIQAPYTKPPSCKKSVSSKRSSSKRSSSKEGSLLDSMDEPQLKVDKKNKKLTLNEVAQIRKVRGQSSREDMESSGRQSDRSSKKTKEGCLMESYENRSKLSRKSHDSDGSSPSRSRSRSHSREKDIMIDSSKVSDWLPSNTKNHKKHRPMESSNVDSSRENRWDQHNNSKRISDTYGSRSSLEEFIKPIGPLVKQGAGTFYLQQYLSNPSSVPVNDQWQQDSYEDEPQKRVSFNDMFGKKTQQKRCMPRTEVHHRR